MWCILFKLPSVLTGECQGSDIVTVMSLHVNGGIVRDPPPPSSAIIKITKSGMGLGHMSDIQLLRVAATTHALNQALIPVVPEAQLQMTTQLLWLPEPVLRRALPQMVATYYKSSTTHKQEPRRKRGGVVGKRASQGTIVQRMSADGPEVIDLTLD